MAEPNKYDILDTVFDPRGTLQKEQAFYGILACAILADDMEHENEAEELNALVHRTPTLHAVKPKDYKAMQAMVKPFLTTANTRANLLANSCASLPQEMRRSVYAHACDIIFADAVVVPLEIQFLKRLAEALAIEPDDARRTIEFIQIKNEY